MDCKELEESLEDFRDYLRKQNKTKNTITAYCGSVRLFFGFLKRSLRRISAITARS